ncbi:glycosyltransferase family 39 protein [Candidatus Micrarchaeota archaeon]|nr:glycosyltransferase family 39 protein [Candidatus Micrarchaeota archaeon]
MAKKSAMKKKGILGNGGHLDKGSVFENSGFFGNGKTIGKGNRFGIGKIHLLLGIYLLLQLALLVSNPKTNIDSGWTAEVSNEFAMNGKLATPSWGGFLQLENGFYWRPPLFFLVEGIFYKLLGFGLLQTSVLMALLVALTVFASFAIARENFGENSGKFTLALMVSNFMFVLLSIFHGRPDILVALFNLLSLRHILRYEKTKKEGEFLKASLFAALSVLTHEIGLLFVASIAVLVVKWNFGNFKRMGLYLAKLFSVVAIVLMPWLIYVFSNLNVAISQISWLLGRHGSILDVLRDEFVRYYWLFTTNNYASAPWYLVVFAIFAYGIWKRGLDAISIVVLTHIALLFFVGNKATYYVFAFAPLLAIFAGREIANLRKGIRKTIANGTVLVLIGASVILLAAYSVVVSQTYNYYLLNSYLDENYKEKVIAQPAFYFAMGNRMYSAYAIYNRMENGEKLDEILRSVGAKTLFYDPENLDASSPAEFKEMIKEKGALIEIVCVENGILLKNSVCENSRFRMEIYKLG